MFFLRRPFLVTFCCFFVLSMAHSRELKDELVHRHLDFDDDGHSCGTPRPTRDQEASMRQAVNDWKRRNRNRRLSDISHEIPVHFVVMQAEDGRGNITDLEIEDGLLGKLNSGFRGSPFTFKLMSIRREFNDTYFKCQEKIEFQEKYKIGGSDTLNVYICNVFAVQFGVYGFSRVQPDSVEDGVVLMNPALDKADLSYMLMNNLFVHEVGHWMGLLHTFHNGCEDGGDSVADTPAHSKATSKTPGVASCWRDVDPPLNTCPDNVTSVDPGLDPIDNYMNFLYFKTGDWGFCYEEYARFTPGQIERMTAIYESYRLQSETVAPTISPTPKPTIGTRPPPTEPAPFTTLTPVNSVEDVASSFPTPTVDETATTLVENKSSAAGQCVAYVLSVLAILFVLVSS